MAAAFDIKTVTYADLKSRHVFLRDLDPADKAAAIAKIPNNERLRLASRSAFPGTDVSGLSWDEAARKGGIDFTVTEEPVYYTNESGPVRTIVPGYKALVKTDRKPISIVSDTYGTLQNSDAFAGFKALCDAGHAVPASVWSKDGGRQVGAAALIGNSAIAARIGGDKPEVFAHYIVARGGFTGQEAQTFERYCAQLICFNGAVTNARESRVYLKHSSRVTQRVGEANEALVKLINDAVEEQRLFEELAQSKFDLRQFLDFADELLGGIDLEKASDRSKTIYSNKLEELGFLFTEGQGNHGQSKLDAYSAITEWLTPRRAQYEDAAKFAAKFYNDTAAGARPAQLRERAVRLLTK